MTLYLLTSWHCEIHVNGTNEDIIDIRKIDMSTQPNIQITQPMQIMLYYKTGHNNQIQMHVNLFAKGQINVIQVNVAII